MDSGLPGENPHATHWEMPWVGLECAVSRHGSTLQTAAPPCQPSPLINWLSCPGCAVPERSRPSLHDSWLQLDRLHTKPAQVTGDEHFDEFRGTNKRRENIFFEAFDQQKIYDIFRFNGLSLGLTIIWMIWSCALEFFRNSFVLQLIKSSNSVSLGLLTYCVLEKGRGDFFYYYFLWARTWRRWCMYLFFPPSASLALCPGHYWMVLMKMETKETRRSGYLRQQASTRLNATCSIWNVLVQSTKRTKKIMESLPNLTLSVSTRARTNTQRCSQMCHMCRQIALD